MRLLLDAHLAPSIARELGAKGIDAAAVRDWLGGNYRVAPDDLLLAAAEGDDRVLVTSDCRTIPPLLREWAEMGRPHAGVVLVDNRTIRPSDRGTLLRALEALYRSEADLNWRDRVVFLQAR